MANRKTNLRRAALAAWRRHHLLAYTGARHHRGASRTEQRGASGLAPYRWDNSSSWTRARGSEETCKPRVLLRNAPPAPV